MSDRRGMDRPNAPPLTPQGWLDALFASKAAQRGEVIQRKARDIERYAGWALFRAEIERRGYRAVENSGQVVIFCKRAAVRPLFSTELQIPVSF
ncbi:hypothetical protein [Sinisalibacter aestuarii]|nr:hypothetical protein [Sinisalibacter aestuarii]